MLQTYFGDVYHGGFNVLPQLLRILAEQSTVPVLIHQDHPDSDQMILRTLRRGFERGVLLLSRIWQGDARPGERQYHQHGLDVGANFE
jgi:fructose/tagatose bisphosphate aldolase